MAAGPQTRYQSGDLCGRSGRYSFDGYLDGGWQPAPRLSEMTVHLGSGECMPHIDSTRRPCWWVPLPEDDVGRPAGQA